jgi:serine protease Do
MNAARILPTVLACFFAASSAQAVPSRTMLASGTAFFITHDGYLLTNNHVIKNCKETPKVRGAVSERDAEVIATDPDNDLALLKAEAHGIDIAKFSTVKEELAVGDRVVIVGYPGEAMRTGQSVTKEARVVATSGPHGEDKWLQLDDVLQHGNSGGPLMDSAGNVIGVVSGKLVIRTYLQGAPKEEGTISHSGMAISLKAVKEFLEDQGVRYREADSGLYNSADRLTDNAHRFLVNVRCPFQEEAQEGQ